MSVSFKQALSIAFSAATSHSFNFTAAAGTARFLIGSVLTSSSFPGNPSISSVTSTSAVIAYPGAFTGTATIAVLDET